MVETWYFLLRGDHEHLARGELRALLEVYDSSSTPQCYTMICVAKTRREVAEKVARRAGFVREAGVLLGVEVITEARGEGFPDAPGLALRVDVFKNSCGRRDLEAILNRLRERIRGLRLRGDAEYAGYVSDGYLFTARRVIKASGRSEAFENRPFKRSIALRPEVARALVNLAHLREGEVVLDPFAGTGTVLTEAWLMGIRGVGVEIDPVIARGLRENIAYYGANAIPVYGDSSKTSLTNFDGVATDPPYGRGASTRGLGARAVYEFFLRFLAEYLPHGRFASFLAPLRLEKYVLELASAYGLRVWGRYYHYVHSGLTRVVFAVRAV